MNPAEMAIVAFLLPVLAVALIIVAWKVRQARRN